MRILYKTLCMVIIVSLSMITAHAQQTVTGVVTDANGPVPGVTVAIQGTARATQTDDGGRYTIQASPGEVIVFSIVGYVRQTVTVGNAATVNITLEEEAGHGILMRRQSVAGDQIRIPSPGPTLWRKRCRQA